MFCYYQCYKPGLLPFYFLVNKAQLLVSHSDNMRLSLGLHTLQGSFDLRKAK